MIPHLFACLVLTSLLMLMLRSDLYVLVTKILRHLGWRRADEDFWPENNTYNFWTRKQWADWAALRSGQAGGYWVPLVHLLTCPYCLSAHASTFAFLVWCCVDWRQAPIALAYPAVLIFLLRQTKYD